MRLAVLLTCLAFAACSGEARQAAGDGPDRTGTPAAAPGAAVDPEGAVDTGAAVAPGAVENARPPRADEGTSAPAPDLPWTAGPTRGGGTPAGVATLQAVRSAAHEGFDRLVLEFDGETLPGWIVEYVDAPVRQCGSGHVVELPGDGWLRIHFEPARAHTDQGAATISDRRRTVDLDVVRVLTITCDFEAHVEWVAAVRSPNPYRVLELRSPARLVVDVRHR